MANIRLRAIGDTKPSAWGQHAERWIKRGGTFPTTPQWGVSDHSVDTVVESYDSTTGRVMLKTTAKDGSYVVVAEGDTTNDWWVQMVGRIEPSIDPEGRMKLNRLTRGFGAPKVENYHRTGLPTANITRQRVNLPATFAVSDGEVNVNGGRHVSVGGFTAARLNAASNPTLQGPVVINATTVPVAPPSVVATAVAAVKAAAAITAPSVPVAVPTGFTGSVNRGRIPGSIIQPTPPPVEVIKPEPSAIIHVPPQGVVPNAIDPRGLMRWPSVSADNSIILPKQDEEHLERAMRMHLAGFKRVVALTGPAGTGKTSLAEGLAARHKMPFFKLDAAGMATFDDWTGSVGAAEVNGATVTKWVPSAFIEIVRRDGDFAGVPRIVHLDEANRAENGGSLNILTAILDHTGTVYVEAAGLTIDLDPAVFFTFAYNIGAEYSGTQTIDAAVKDRITDWIAVGYPEFGDEVALMVKRTDIGSADAERLVKAAAAIRQIADRQEIAGGISPRRLIEACRKVVFGASLLDAAKQSWLGSYDPGEREIVKSTLDGALR